MESSAGTDELLRTPTILRDPPLTVDVVRAGHASPQHLIAHGEFYAGVEDHVPGQYGIWVNLFAEIALMIFFQDNPSAGRHSL